MRTKVDSVLNRNGSFVVQTDQGYAVCEPVGPSEIAPGDEIECDLASRGVTWIQHFKQEYLDQKPTHIQVYIRAVHKELLHARNDLATYPPKA